MFENKIKSVYYDKIINKIESGAFVPGVNCIPYRYCYEGHISDYPINKRTQGVCSWLMSYCKCKLSDVPESSRTREFYLDSFTNKEVYKYIVSNIKDFDRQFFKDLIATNQYATHSESNCFEIMPVEYIDEEMISLAMISSTDWSTDDWFFSVYKRKPDAITADLWKLAARLYSKMYGNENKILDITPEKFKDYEYYKEMCSCNYNCNVELDTAKGNIMDSIPQEILTINFLVDLLSDNVNNISRFNELALETLIPYTKDGKTVFEKIWQFVVSRNGSLIRNIPLNDERIEFFLNHYDKNSSEYEWSFKRNYKNYMREKNSPEKLAKTNQTIRENCEFMATFYLLNAFAAANSGEAPSSAFDQEINTYVTSSLPIKFRGQVPEELCKEYDSEEFLEMVYKSLGLEIIEEYDDLYYSVRFPEGWSTELDGHTGKVKDSDGNVVIEYFYNSNFCDRDAYVNTICVSKEKINNEIKKVLNKK